MKRRVLVFQSLSIESDRLVELLDLKGCGIHDEPDSLRQPHQVGPELIDRQPSPVQDVWLPRFLGDRKGMFDLGIHARDELVDRLDDHLALGCHIFFHPAGQAGRCGPQRDGVQMAHDHVPITK